MFLQLEVEEEGRTVNKVLSAVGEVKADHVYILAYSVIVIRCKS
jgi:hypothetical protein